MGPFLTPALLLLLLPCPALLAPPKGTTPDSSVPAPKQSPPSSPKPALVPPHAVEPSHDVNPRAARDVGPAPVPAQPPIKVLITETCVHGNVSAGEGGKDGLVLDLEPGEPLVLTHRISLVPTAAGACGGVCEAQVAAVRERMERLERELSALREKCGGTEGGCCTTQQSTGVHCTRQPGDLCPNDCSDQGRCDQGKCICFPGFTGPDCSFTTCPSDCNGRGTCVNGQCECENGFTGLDCSGNSCPNNCNDKGQCVHGQCVCDDGFAGTDCSEKSCPKNCNYNGKCVDGLCVCNSGFTGTDCSAKSCPSNCSDKGRCVDGQCVCDSGFTGIDCSEKSCPNNCNDKGRCVNGKCVCSSGFTGIDCSEKSCPNKCRKRGHCVNGQCVCNSGFTGVDCSEKSCPNNCNDRGKCVKSKCVCDSGFTGIDCSEKSCPNKCRNRGDCVNGQCVCNSGYTGPDCSEKSCPNNCNDRGKCVKSKCVCDSGFTGIDCSEKSCPNKCRNRGDCVNGQCVCNSGYTGPDCSEKSCPNNCNDRGRCLKGKCACNSGFTGADCSEKACPNKCRNRGHCVGGQCVCNSGFTGTDCSEKSCPSDCSGNGKCVNGKCVCNSGFTGTDCAAKSCPSNCNDRGRCVDGQCVCDHGFTGIDCSEKSCPNNCNNNGNCLDGQCVCNSGFTGTDCAAKSCPSNCNDRGRCVDGQCVCDSGFTGIDCSEKSCPNNCNDRGRCIDGQCVCDHGFTGIDCSEKSCPNNCNDRGRCVDGQCVCDSGFTGIDCSEKSCPNNCNNNGNCLDGQCVCNSGFTGTDCAAKSCPSNCNDRGRCVDGQCVCDSGFTGIDCSEKSCPDNCNDRGRCVDGQCVCDSGFTGIDCSEKSCPNNCNNNGNCLDGQCVCNSGFTGTDCAAKSCPSNCNDRGRCVDGQCVCDHGFTGIDCSEKSCPNNCNNNGKCLDGQCVCNSGFTGTDCTAKSCPSNCNDRGRCVDGQCECDSGFTGIDCSEKSCPNNCNDKGRCVNGKCVCSSGFTGIDCSEKSCPNKCRKRGHCVNGQCVCNSGFTGVDCSEKSCPNNCNDRGRCVKSKCVCDSGFTGIDCSEKSCPNKCRNRGDCVDGQCVCNSGYTGPDCSEKSCPNNCNDRGRCLKGKCACNSGFTGADCSEKTCPNKCRNRGHCVGGQCVCNSGFTGADCSEKSCPSDCSGNGKCVNGKCVCNIAFMGKDCSTKSCPSNCNDRGRCVDGKCVCTSGFTGTDCSEKSCPDNCNNNGKCVDGECVCNSEFTGTDCSAKSCPGNCRDQGRCVDGKCVCNSGFSGLDCSTISCINDCSNRGRCVSGRCICHHGFTGPDCSQCDEGFTGEDCGTALVGVPQLGSRDITDSSVTLFWSPPPLHYDTYFITFASQKEGDQDIISRVDGRLNGYNQTGLAAGQEYSVSIRGEKDGKMGAESTTEVTTLISGPKNLRVVKTSTTSVVVQWEPPLADIDRYRLSITTSQSDGGEEPYRQEMTLPPERDSANITGLEAGHLYDITLVSEKGRSQSQPIRMEATPVTVPLLIGKATILDTAVAVEMVTVVSGLGEDLARPTNPDGTVIDRKTEKEDEDEAEGPKVWRGYSGKGEGSDGTKVDPSPVKTDPTKPQDKGKDGVQPKLPGRLLIPKKPKVWGSPNFNGTRRMPGKIRQKQPGVKHPVYGVRRKIIQPAGQKPKNATSITDGAPSLTDTGKRPRPESIIPEVGINYGLNSSPGKGGNGTPSNQSKIDSEGAANPEMLTETSAKVREGVAEQRNLTRGNMPHIIRKKVGYRKGNGTIWALRKTPRLKGGARRPGQKERDGAGVGAASGLERGGSGSDINNTTGIVDSDPLRKGGGDRELQGESKSNSQGPIQITQTQESSEQPDAQDKYQPRLPALPTASSSSSLPSTSGLPEENIQTDTPDNTRGVGSHRGSKHPLSPSLHATDPSTPESQSESDSPARSKRPEQKGDSMQTPFEGNKDAGPDRTPKQHFGKLGPVDEGSSQETAFKTTDSGAGFRDQDSGSQGLEGSQETMSRVTDTSTGPDGTPDKHSGILVPGEKGVSQKTTSLTTDTVTDLDGTRDQHSGSQDPGDKGGPPETVPRVRYTGAGPDGTQDQHSGSQRPGEKEGSLKAVSMMTDSGSSPEGTQDEHSSIPGPGDKEGSLPTMTDTGIDLDGTQDRHSRKQGSGDQGSSLKTVSMPTKANMTHKNAIPKGVIDSTKKEGNNGVEGGGIPVREGQERHPVKSGHPGLRTPHIRRPHVGPFRNRTRPNLAAPHHPSKGPYRRPNAPDGPHRFSVGLSKKEGGDGRGNINRTATKVSPSRVIVRGDGLSGKTRHSHPKIGRNFTSIQAGLPRKTGPPKQRGIKKVIVYTPVATGILKKPTDLGSSPPTTGPDFTTIGVQNVTSSGFILIWEVSPGIYHNFTVTGREYGGEGRTEREKEEDRKGSENEEEDEEVDEVRGGKGKGGSRKDQGRTADGSRSESDSSAEPREKTPKFIKELPGSARSLQLQDLAPRTSYVLMLSGTGPGLRSKIHQFTITTGPDAPSDLSFSEVTDSSFAVSWAKPKGPVSGYQVTYMRDKDGEPVSVEMDPQDSAVSLRGLYPGSTYVVRVISLLGLDESDPIKGSVVTLPDPPTDLRAINVTHNKALLLWRPALATVDRYIIVYGSEQGERVAVSGNAAELQLDGLQQSTEYVITIRSLLDGRQSSGTSTVFTTAGGPEETGQEGPRNLTANNVTPRSAVLSWQPPPLAVTGYKLIYQAEGEEAKEVTLDPNVTQYKLTRLFPMSKYTVHLQGERHGQYTAASSTEFTTGVLPYPFPVDCSEELLNGMESGEADIFPGGRRGGPVPVYCDMETDGGGWTVFQRRVDGRTNFFRTWSEYKKGFGNLSRDFWLGNDLLHNLTRAVPMAMRVDLRVGAESVYAHYSSFSVDTETKYYTLRLAGYSGTAGDSLVYHSQQRFSTWDRDTSTNFITRCAMSYRGGWWYHNCHEANLNGLYNTHTNHQGVIWSSWKGTDFSIPFTEMKIRPASFTPPSQG